MRLNKYISSQVPTISRRKADELIINGAIYVNDQKAVPGTKIVVGDKVTIKNVNYTYSGDERPKTTIMLNKPAGYVCGRDGQGAQTVYDLLPYELRGLNIAGRLDKDSRGLVLMTDDGELLNNLTHPKNVKQKIYQVTLDRGLNTRNHQIIIGPGVDIGDNKPSKLSIRGLSDDYTVWEVVMHEGRNRQIRRTFEKLGLEVVDLKRIAIAQYSLNDLAEGNYKVID
jgi:23S rRNA pseudouridine2605 synthase